MIFTDKDRITAAALFIVVLLVFTGCGSTDAQEIAADGQESIVDEQETVTDGSGAEIIPRAWETPVIELGEDRKSVV